MKTTLDLPNDLVREMKLRAVVEGKKLKDLAAEMLQRGLAAPVPPAVSPGRRRAKLPIIQAPKGAPRFELTGKKLHELEMETEIKSHEASLRR